MSRRGDYPDVPPSSGTTTCGSCIWWSGDQGHVKGDWPALCTTKRTNTYHDDTCPRFTPERRKAPRLKDAA